MDDDVCTASPEDVGLLFRGPTPATMLVLAKEGEDLETNEGEWTGNVEVGEACVAIF